MTYEGELPDEIKAAITDSLPDEATPSSVLQARRQSRRARDIVADVLNSYGYYDPEISLTVVEGGEENSQLRAGLSVTPKEQFTLDRILFNYVEPQPLSEDQIETEKTVLLKSGDPAIPLEIIDAERVITRTLRRDGYAFAEVTGRDVIGDPEAHTISVRYNINSGSKIVIGEMKYSDNTQVRHSYLDRINPLQTGQVYAPRDMGLFNSRLAESRQFDVSSAFLSEEPSGTNEDGYEIRDVIVELADKPRHSLTLGASIDTVNGPGLTASLLRRNLTKRADLLVADMILSERESGIDISWRRPNELGYGQGLVLGAGLRQENTDAFDLTEARLSAAIEVVEGPDFSYSYGLAASAFQEDSISGQRDFQTVSAFVTAQIDRTDDLLDPRQGWRANARLEPTVPFSGGATDPYLKSIGQIRAYYPFDDAGRFVLAGRVKAGALLGGSVFDIPIAERFFAGGGGSVRGYSYQGIGPLDANNVPLGGRSLIEGSIEGRYRINDTYGFAAFIDAGDVSDEAYPTFDSLKFGIGAGLRYQTPAGPLRADIAIPLDKGPNDEDVQVYLSIGQAF